MEVMRKTPSARPNQHRNHHSPEWRQKQSNFPYNITNKRKAKNEVHHHKETGFEEILVISRFDRDARPGETITFHAKLLFYMQCLNKTLIKM